MNANNILAHAGIATLLSLSACADNSAARADKSAAQADRDAARALERDAVQALDGHSENPNEARRESHVGDKPEKVGEANEERAQDQDTADADDRFALRPSETDAEFAARAKQTIAALDRDLAQVKTDKVPADDLRDVEEKLAEARKDLDEMNDGDARLIGDGKLGVTMAINSARRKLDRIQEDLADGK